ncbi:hypothetical protein GALL_439920 [mine drainage metagenome]|uniref:Uncharacterized protein n=1 Tax=mine drainage metagenome TaxID=410659 RepID=A0A1J5PT97_9ZZZZ
MVESIGKAAIALERPHHDVLAGRKPDEWLGDLKRAAHAALSAHMRREFSNLLAAKNDSAVA